MACYTYIQDPLLKLFLMTFLLISISILSVAVKPYKQTTTNFVSIVSFAVNILIAVVSLFKAVLENFGCQTNCSFQKTLVVYFALSEKLVFTYVPIAAVIVWLLFMGVQKCAKKNKEE